MATTLEINQIKLNSEELNEIKGGEIIPPETTEEALKRRNTNRTSTCTCNYENFDVIKNINTSEGCRCNCV